MYFASPPSDDAPIVLGPPSDDPFGGGGGDFGDFAAQPDSNYGEFVHTAPDSDPAAYLGDVNEAPSGFMMMGDDEDNDNAAFVDAAAEEEPPVPAGPTPMQVWNEGWQALLLERKDAENAKKAEFMQAAESEMAAFQAEREQKREAAMRKNREDEQVKLEAIEADLENDNSWQRVCKMVELQHDSTQKSQDVKRMRDVMILLKNDPTKAQTLAA